MGGQSNTAPSASNTPTMTVVVGKSSNVGSIVGEVVGGVAVLALIIGGMYLIYLHTKNHVLAESERLRNQGGGTVNMETMPTKMDVQHATVESRV